MENKILFFGFEIESFWQKLKIKTIDVPNRHLTLLYLGKNKLDEIKTLLSELPKMDRRIAMAGFFDKCLFIPEKSPRLVAYHINFLGNTGLIEKFQKDLFEFFKKRGFLNMQKNKSFLPHVTICRKDFDIEEIKKSFRPMAMYLKSFNLYESLGNSQYKIIWKNEFLKPFEEIEHTADIAFIIRGYDFQDLLLNGFIALCSKSPDLLAYFQDLRKARTIDDVIINLNELVTKAEIDGIDIPFKALSFHADIEKRENILNWEMIIDV